MVKTDRMTKGGGGEGERALTSPSNWALSPPFGQPWGRTLLNWHIPWQAGITNPGGRAKPLSNFTPRDMTSGNSGTAAFHKGKHATVFTKVIAIKLSSKTVRKAQESKHAAHSCLINLFQIPPLFNYVRNFTLDPYSFWCYSRAGKEPGYVSIENGLKKLITSTWKDLCKNFATHLQTYVTSLCP